MRMQSTPTPTRVDGDSRGSRTITVSGAASHTDMPRRRPSQATLALVSGLAVRDLMSSIASTHDVEATDLRVLLQLHAAAVRGACLPELPQGQLTTNGSVARLAGGGLVRLHRSLLRRRRRVRLTAEGQRLADQVAGELHTGLSEALRPLGVAAGRYVREAVAQLCSPEGPSRRD